jgi:hypothetical protein
MVFNLNDKGVSLPLTIIGLVLILIACVVAFTNVGMTRDQINAGDSFNQFAGDYFVRWGIAIVLTVIGSVATGFGLKR